MTVGGWLLVAHGPAMEPPVAWWIATDGSGGVRTDDPAAAAAGWGAPSLGASPSLRLHPSSNLPRLRHLFLIVTKYHHRKNEFRRMFKPLFSIVVLL